MAVSDYFSFIYGIVVFNFAAVRAEVVAQGACM